jgi:ATP-dependent exoDNAse (exonuclease V) beta subunit
MFARIRPSDLAHTAGPVDLRALLRLDRGATDRGTLAHAWFEQVEWLEDGVPAADQLRSIAATTCSGYPPDATERLLGEFREWLAAPQIASVLSRASYPAGATVLREQPVLHRDGDALMEGVIDRLVLLRDAQGSVTGADILDYKSDAVDASEADALDTLVVRYRPQLGAYRRGVAAMFGIEREGVKAKLVILAAGAVINVE